MHCAKTPRRRAGAPWMIPLPAALVLMCLGSPLGCPPHSPEPPPDANDPNEPNNDANQPLPDPCAGLVLCPASNLRLFSSPRLHPTYELRWDFECDALPDQQFAIYETQAIDQPATLLATAPATARQIEVTLPLDSRLHRFHIVTIAGGCLDGPASPGLAVNTAERIAFAAKAPEFAGMKRVFTAFHDWPTPVELGLGIMPVWSPDTMKIAFRDGDRQFAYIVSADGSTAPVTVSGAPADRVIDGPMVWSPRSDRVAFLKAIPYRPHVIGPTDHHLFVSTTDGRAEPVRIGPDLRLHPGYGSVSYAWSHDGEWLVFRGWAEAGRNNQVYLARADGSAPPMQISDVNPDDSDARLPDRPFAPDGASFAFVGTDRVPDDSTGHYVETLFLVDMATLTPQPLVTAGLITVTGWSPDGQYIGFMVTNDRTHTLQGSYIIARDGSAEPIPIGADNPDFHLPGPIWSPDGAWLVYTDAADPNDPFDPWEQPDYELFAVPAGDLTAPVKIASTQYDVAGISWSPTADRMVVLLDTHWSDPEEERKSLFLWRPGVALEAVPVDDPDFTGGDGSAISNPKWANDGARLLFEVHASSDAYPYGYQDTYLLDLRTRAAPRRLDGVMSDGRYEWIDGAAWAPLGN